MKQAMFLVLLVSLVGSFKEVRAGITQVEAAELSLHRAERLIDLGKIDETYSGNFHSLAFEVLPGPVVAGQAQYRIVHQQVPNSDGTANKLELLEDSDGKPVPNDFKTTEGSPSSNPPQWPDKIATELTEEPLHAITRLNKDEYQDFIKNLATITLFQTKAPDGTLRALVVVTARGTTDTLETLVLENGKLDGEPTRKTK